MESDLITPAAGGVYVDVYVQPGAKHPGLKGRHGGALKVAVTALAIEGQANRAILEAIAEVFSVRPTEVEVVAGQHSRHKRLFLNGISVPEARSMIQTALEADLP
jgi:hypothetical protein